MQSDEKKAILSIEDINNVEEFFRHFSIPIPKYLQDQIDIYKANLSSYSLENQERFKAELSRAIIESDHELLQDDIFSNIKHFCDEVWYNAQFERDLEEVLTDDET